MRLIVSAASRVWSDESTKWPVSAALSGVDGRGVTHLTDHDDIGILSEHPSHCFGEPARIHAHFALAHHRQLVVVECLNGIFHGDDVATLRRIDVIEQRRECRGLSGTGRSRDENKSPGFGGDRTQHGGKTERVKVTGWGPQHPDGETHPAPLPIGVDPEPAAVRESVRKVGLVGLLERDLEPIGNQRLEIQVHFEFVERPSGERAELAIDPHRGRCSPAQMQIRGAIGDSDGEKLVDGWNLLGHW